MSDRYQIAIIGAGPAGLSAAARAAEVGLSYILLEASTLPADTVQHYQKGKYVMAEPAILPLHSTLPFEASSREAVLESWQTFIRRRDLNIRYKAKVTGISGQQGDFNLDVTNGGPVCAEFVIISIGLQGNRRKLDVPGADCRFVQYHLDDPDEYRDENIVVVGAGDSAIENALALTEHNEVILLNRRDEFARARESNRDAILNAISTGKIECHYSTNLASIESIDRPVRPVTAQLKTSSGLVELQCERVIARLGATPPREFLSTCGIEFTSEAPDALPVLDNRYQSTVAGFYIIGSLAGYPLIKQALNQGYEVVEFIRDQPVTPADEPILHEKFKDLPAFQSVEETLETVRRNVPLLSGLTTLQLREFLMESEVRLPRPGDTIFEYNDYTNSFYSIVSGEVRVFLQRDNPKQVITLRQGQFFGEIGLISGRRRTVTVKAGAGQQCVLIETPRQAMNKLINSVESVKAHIDRVFMLRAIQAHIAPEIPATDLAAVVQSATIEQFGPGDILFEEGDIADCIHLIRKGSATVLRNIGGNQITLSYVAAGNYVGEMALLSDMPRSATVRATVATETIRLDGDDFMALLKRSPELHHQVERKFQERIAQNQHMEGRPQAGNIISFMVQQGLGEATDVLLIDESLCIHCDNCERACAETHGGTSRLDRDAGATFARIHVPTSCRHCEHPHCMKDCPPDAIHRASNGEVFIADNCIGCGNCERNCPYGVIQMATENKKKPSLLTWLLLGLGPGPGHALPMESGEKKAVKCDMCKDLRGGPACVRACPTGAAARVSPEAFMSIALGEES